MNRIAKSILGLIFICLSGNLAAASLLGDEVYHHRIFDNPAGPFVVMADEVIATVGPGPDFTTGSGFLEWDIDDSSVRVTAIANTSFTASDPHEIRLFVPERIININLVESLNFGGLTTARLSHSAHILFIDVNDLDNIDAGGHILIDLELADEAKVPTLSPLGIAVLLLGMMGIAVGMQHVRRKRA